MAVKGIVTEIQRFSLKDGPGIRTTVFLKGCNMACQWCHNPETISPRPQLLRYPHLCIGCGACAAVCNTGAIGPDGFVREKCMECGMCTNECFSGALEMAGIEMDVDAVMREVLQDADYYRNSGGGLTISGGEVICQPEFACALLESAKAAGISAAIETNMHADWAVYEKLIPLLDLVMPDIKIISGNAHTKWTGVCNRPVLENIRRLSDAGIPVIIRTPVIPGVNDDPGEIELIAGFIAGLGNVQYYELLLYNPLGEGKYSALGIENRFRGAMPSDAGKQALLLKAAEKAGVPVRIG